MRFSRNRQTSSSISTEIWTSKISYFQCIRHFCFFIILPSNILSWNQSVQKTRTVCFLHYYVTSFWRPSGRQYTRGGFINEQVFENGLVPETVLTLLSYCPYHMIWSKRSSSFWQSSVKFCWQAIKYWPGTNIKWPFIIRPGHSQSLSELRILF